MTEEMKRGPSAAGQGGPFHLPFKILTIFCPLLIFILSYLRESIYSGPLFWFLPSGSPAGGRVLTNTKRINYQTITRFLGFT